MTKQQLRQFRFLEKEIELVRRQIKDTEKLIKPENIVDFVKGSMQEFPYAERSIKVEGVDLQKYERQVRRLRKKLMKHLSELVQQQEEIFNFIQSIPDCQVRLIISLKYIEGLTWKQIALKVGGGNSADGVRNTCNRFLHKQQEN